MANRGRPKKVITQADLDKLKDIIILPFYTKKQEEYLKIKDKKSDFTADEIELIKENLRQKNAYDLKADLYNIIRQKSKTAIKLTALEQEILGYDFSQKDDFFNCLKALTTYSKLEKIAKSEIERAEDVHRQEAIKKTLNQQTAGQKRRKENERRKYFLGGVVLKYVDFLRENYIFSQSETEQDILVDLVQSSILSNYLFEVTKGDHQAANNVRAVIKKNHLELFERLDVLAEEIAEDKRG